MSVTTENVDSAVRMCRRSRQENVPGGETGEMRRPLVVGDFTFVPAGKQQVPRSSLPSYWRLRLPSQTQRISRSLYDMTPRLPLNLPNLRRNINHLVLQLI